MPFSRRLCRIFDRCHPFPVYFFPFVGITRITVLFGVKLAVTQSELARVVQRKDGVKDEAYNMGINLEVRNLA